MTKMDDIVFPGRNYSHLEFESPAKPSNIVASSPMSPLPATRVSYVKNTKTVNVDHVRTRAYYLWKTQRDLHPNFGPVDFWLLAERIEAAYG